MGNIIRQLYFVGNNLEPSQDKTSLANRRIRHGQQLAYEYKSFHSVRLREILESISPLFYDKKDIHVMHEIVHQKMMDVSKIISLAQSKSLINAWKGTSQEISKITTDYLVPKNYIFVNNLKRQIVPLVDKRKNGSQLSWEHRTIHQSEMFFVCCVQSTEDAGKFKTPALYTFLTVNGDEKKLVEIIKKHPHFIKNKLLNNLNELYSVRLNGSIIGYVKQYKFVDEFYEFLMSKRRDGTIEQDISIVLNHHLGTVDVWVDIGRIVSPFVVIKNCFEIKKKSKMKGGNKKSILELIKENNFIGGDNSNETTITPKSNFLEWLVSCSTEINSYQKGIREGFIEYYDPEMAIHNILIAPCIEEFYENPFLYSHIALPNHMLGIVASTIPMNNASAGARSI
jgi:DNA-directed RNA polymerase beta subunit